MDTNQHNEADESADTGAEDAAPIATAPSRPDDPIVAAVAAGKTTRERSSESQRQRQLSQRHNPGPPLDDDEEPAERLAGDLLVGAELIEAHLKHLGVPDPDAYYLRRTGKWPIGKYGANLIASKRRLNRHAEKITRGATAA